jgi:L-alanine-DL-glutamate epimerase-like enolase superfamily enzyme
MKVSRFTILAAPPRWLFLQIETDKGVTGWGEPVLEARAATVAAAQATAASGYGMIRKGGVGDAFLSQVRRPSSTCSSAASTLERRAW